MTTTDTTPLQLTILDPTLIRTTDQIRQDATPDSQLIDSVAANGILQPPTVVWNPDEAAHFVVFGARRVGAAIIAGLTEIPVIVRDPATLTGALMLEEQIVENERRAAVTTADLARGWARLESLFGETAEDIAARTGEKPERVAAGIRAARSEKTTALLATRPALDLERAAQLTEFDEHPAVQAELTAVAIEKPADFDWRVRSARDHIEKDEKTAELKAEIRASKVKLATTDGYGSLKAGTSRLSNLVDGSGKKLTPKNHADCPGHRAYLDGYRATDLKIEYACEGFRDHGHTYPGAAPRELTEDEKREKREQEERAAALTANRAARRQWIRDLLPGKINQLPGVYEYMATALLAHNGQYADHRAPKHTLDLLGVSFDTDSYGADTRALDDLIATKRVAPFRMMLATALGIHEKRTETGYHQHALIRHLEQLQRWGYPLTEIDENALTTAGQQLAADAAANTDDVDEDGEDQ